MELLREYNISDKQLIANVQSAISIFQLSKLNTSLCRALRMTELKECLTKVADVNKRILECTDTSKLSIYQQSEILRMNRLYAMFQILDTAEQDSFINHEPVRAVQSDLTKVKVVC